MLGKTDSQICPVAAILTYLHLRGQKNGPMFIFKDGSPLTPDKFSCVVNQTVKMQDGKVTLLHTVFVWVLHLQQRLSGFRIT